MKMIWPVFLAALLGGCLASTQTTKDLATVQIIRDEYGVPHIYADDLYGVYFGYGHAIAQDRLFQMEMARRSTQGKVSEVLGPGFVDYDRNTRTLFSPASIKQQIAALPQHDLSIFSAYAAGINQWLSTINQQPETLMPKQFLDLDFKPQPWTAYDVVMIFVGTMNNRYGDFNTELENAAIVAELTLLHGSDKALALFDLLNPRFTDNAPTTIPRQDWSSRLLKKPSMAFSTPLSENGDFQKALVFNGVQPSKTPVHPCTGRCLPKNDVFQQTARPAPDILASNRVLPSSAMSLAAVPPSITPSGFSNVFVIGKNKAQDASAILVNGPQFGWFNPAYVYSVGLHAPGIDVVGNTPFGYPMIMFGHNRDITWGSTWGASDIVDLFAEQMDETQPNTYFYHGKPKRFDTREEVILVKGQDPVVFEAHRSIHGPIVRIDNDANVAYAKKRSWDGVELNTLLAWLRATWASDWVEWKTQAEKSAINVNMYFADAKGNIGYFHGGHFPVRADGHDNRFPVTGDGSMDWRGRQSADVANPHVLNPAGDVLANWNNKPGQGVMNPDFFFYSWSRADRVDYLHTALTRTPRISPDEAWNILAPSSYADVYAPYLLPLIDQAVRTARDPAVKRANAILQAWDRQSVDNNADGFYDQQATGLFRRFVDAFIRLSLSDDLGKAFAYFSASGYPTATVPTGAGTNLPTGLKAIIRAADGESSVDVFNGQSAEDIALQALQEVLEDDGLKPLETAPRPFLAKNFLGIPQADESEVLVAPIEQNRGTENNMIVMRPGAIEGWEVTPPGQSGFIAPDGSRSQHYQDQFTMYQQFGRKRMWFYRPDVEAHQASVTTLSYPRLGH